MLTESRNHRHTENSITHYTPLKLRFAGRYNDNGKRNKNQSIIGPVLSAEDMLKSAVIEKKKFKHSPLGRGDNPLGPKF